MVAVARKKVENFYTSKFNDHVPLRLRSTTTKLKGYHGRNYGSRKMSAYAIIYIMSKWSRGWLRLSTRHLGWKIRDQKQPRGLGVWHTRTRLKEFRGPILQFKKKSEIMHIFKKSRKVFARIQNFLFWIKSLYIRKVFSRVLGNQEFEINALKMTDNLTQVIRSKWTRGQ